MCYGGSGYHFRSLRRMCPRGWVRGGSTHCAHFTDMRRHLSHSTPLFHLRHKGMRRALGQRVFTLGAFPGQTVAWVQMVLATSRKPRFFLLFRFSIFELVRISASTTHPVPQSRREYYPIAILTNPNSEHPSSPQPWRYLFPP